jgi:hypothetical protein
MTKLAFIGAGSTIFMKNIVGDMLHFEALRDAEITLMDIDARRLEESRMVAEKMIATMGTGATVQATTDRARALDGADFVVTAFQIGGYRPSTVIDFDIPESLRAAADHRRYARRRRDHAGASDRPASLGGGRRHGAALPRCAAAAIREPGPDGDQLLVCLSPIAADWRRTGFLHFAFGLRQAGFSAIRCRTYFQWRTQGTE